MKRCGILSLALGMLIVLTACRGSSAASNVHYTPRTRAFALVTVPLLVKESETTFDFLKKDFARGGVLEGKEVYAFSPDHLTVYQGDTVNLTIVNPEDDLHTFVLSDFNVDVLLPPQATTKVHFIANKAGIFTFLCDVASHTPFMTGQFTILPDTDAST